MPLVFLILLFLFLYAEIALVIEAGSRIGALGVIAAFILSAALGFFVIRRQGLQAYRSLQQTFAAGSDPVEDISNGFLLLLAGLLLIVPGFLTDAFGLLLMAPPVRALLIRRGMMRRARVFYSFSSARPSGPGPAIVEGEYREKGNGGQKGKPQPRLPRRGEP